MHSSRLAEKNFYDMMTAFIKKVGDQMGVEMVVLAGYRNQEGNQVRMK